MLKKTSTQIIRMMRWLPPETAHNLALYMLPLAQKIKALPGEAAAAQAFTWQGLRFANRVGLAAGFDKNGDAIDALAACGFGFVEIGTLTPKPQQGNPRPRMFRLTEHQAIINRMGFNNKGIDYAAQKLKCSGSEIIKGVNIGKNYDTPMERAADDYVQCMERVYPWCDYLVANISSPNTTNIRNLQLGKERDKLFWALASARDRLEQAHSKRVPILIKVSPDLQKGEITGLINSLVANGLEGIIATNTTIRRPQQIATSSHANQQGGLSGKPLFPHALASLQALAKLLPKDKMLIGVGGIGEAEELEQFFKAGAKLIQVYSSLVYQGVGLVKTLVEAEKRFKDNGVGQAFLGAKGDGLCVEKK